MCGTDFDEASFSYRSWLLRPVSSRSPTIASIFLSQLLLFDWFQDPKSMVIEQINYNSIEVEGDHTLIAGDDLIQSRCEDDSFVGESMYDDGSLVQRSS